MRKGFKFLVLASVLGTLLFALAHTPLAAAGGINVFTDPPKTYPVDFGSNSDAAIPIYALYGTPGMPTTGAGMGAGTLFGLTWAAGLLLAGLAVRRRGTRQRA